MTFQSIELQSLQAYVHLKGQALSDFIEAQGWTEANGVVSIPVNKDNEAKTVVLAENIRFERKYTDHCSSVTWELGCYCALFNGCSFSSRYRC